MVHTEEDLDELDGRIAALLTALTSGEFIKIEAAIRSFMDFLCFDGWWRPTPQELPPFVSWSYIDGIPANQLIRRRLFSIVELVVDGRENPAMMAEVPEACERYLAIRGKLNPCERGVSWFDVALVVEDGDDLAAGATAKRWQDTKKLTAVTIGKCPQDGRRQLYRLSDVLADLKILMRCPESELREYRKQLAPKCRCPAEGKSLQKL